ncbi:MAG: TatD family hydrolase [Candidatus Pacearchaeota archaeon]|jgi:TatD DNase family protein
MVTYIDVHCHIDRYEDEKIKGIIERARKAGIGIIINNGNNIDRNKKILEMFKDYNEVKIALGIYPTECLDYDDKRIDEEIKFIRKNKAKIVAIGEVGIDLNERGDIEKQKKNLGKFVKLAMELNKPIIIHSRKAELETVEFLEGFKYKKIIMHCFSGKMSLVKRILDNGWYLSIPANVKYSEHFQNVIKIAPIEQLFCETDSPWLHPDKELNNEPANVIESYKKIAEIKKMKFENVKNKIFENYERLFLSK